MDFEPADGGEGEGDWEEWPDRYVYDIVVSSSRVEALCRLLFALLPGRVYPILDVLGSDAHREVDPYIAYEPVGFDRVLDGVRRHREWLFEDGLVGFGAMSEEPFLHVYIDEHKIVTVRVESQDRERVERALGAFELEQMDSPLGVDSVAHEHRTVLHAPPDRPDLLAAEEIIEELMDLWRLELNVDRDRNMDDEGRELGVTPWRCVVRRWEVGEDADPEYAEVFLTADCLASAEETAIEAAAEARDREQAQAPKAPAPPEKPAPEVEEQDEVGTVADMMVVLADRLEPDTYRRLTGAAEKESLEESRVQSVRWLRE
jgi:hypothetical protein